MASSQQTFIFDLLVLYSPRYQTVPPKGLNRSYRRVLFWSDFACLTAERTSSSSHSATCRLLHHFTDTPFLGGHWGHSSLQLFSVANPSALQSFKYMCMTTPSFNRYLVFSKNKIFLSYGDLKKSPQLVSNWICPPSSLQSPTLFSTLTNDCIHLPVLPH